MLIWYEYAFIQYLCIIVQTNIYTMPLPFYSRHKIGGWLFFIIFILFWYLIAALKNVECMRCLKGRKQVGDVRRKVKMESASLQPESIVSICKNIFTNPFQYRPISHQTHLQNLNKKKITNHYKAQPASFQTEPILMNSENPVFTKKKKI